MKRLKFTRKEQKELVSKGKKGCSNCGEILPLDCFGKQNTKLGYRSYCRYCRHVHQMEKEGSKPKTKEDFWHRHGLRGDNFIDKKGKIRNQERDRVNYIRRVYKVDFDEALDLYKKTTTGNCEVCGKYAEKNGKALSVDHCHSNGHVRGVLCDKCNTGLGMFEDNINYMKNAIKYLNKKEK
jgi:hypothetical protein